MAQTPPIPKAAIVNVEGSGTAMSRICTAFTVEEEARNDWLLESAVKVPVTNCPGLPKVLPTLPSSVTVGVVFPDDVVPDWNVAVELTKVPELDHA